MSGVLCAAWLLSACAKGADGGEYVSNLVPQSPGAIDAGAGTGDAGALLDVALDADSPDPSVEGGAGTDAETQLNTDTGAADSAAADTGIAGLSFTPSNLNIALLGGAAAPGAILNCGVTEVDTSEPVRFTNWCGAQPTPVVSTQSGGPDLVVLPLEQLLIDAGNTLRVTGSRPLVLFVKGTVTIAGNLDVGASAGIPGPGGDQLCAASAGGDGLGDRNRNGAGGGGGGFGTQGGQGGDDSGSESVPGAAGQVRGTSSLVPLLAGCGGGRGGGSCAGTPGAGGGALQITAGGALVVRGVLRADGGDGAEGCSNDAGGTGAGSGGGLLLEADSIDVTGATITAKGGTGGEGQSGRDPGEGASSAAEVGGEGDEGSGSGGGGGGGGFGRISLRAQGQCSGC
jgi:hypothetical protein